MKNSNVYFRPAEPSWANACVGNNGSPDEVDYGLGFLSSAKLLLKQVLEEEGITYPVDIFVYPICFNIRHALEIYLKLSIRKIEKILELKKGLSAQEQNKNSHDLLKIWNHLKQIAVLCDRRFVSVLQNIEDSVVELAAVDSTGQVFRYPFNTKNDKHLREIACISLELVSQMLSRLEEGLQVLNKKCDQLGSEYGWGTHTKHLSRADLVEIAHMLPKRSKWGEEAFAAVKLKIKEKYCIGSKELSDALNKIQQRPEIARLIGLESTLPTATENSIFLLLLNWLQLNQYAEEDSGETFPKDLYYARRVEVLEYLNGCLASDDLAIIKALYAFRKEDPYSEVYDYILNEERIEAGQNNDFLKKENIRYLFAKNNLMDSLIYSLDFLGYDGVAERLLTKLNMHHKKADFTEPSMRKKKMLNLMPD